RKPKMTGAYSLARKDLSEFGCLLVPYVRGSAQTKRKSSANQSPRYVVGWSSKGQRSCLGPRTGWVALSRRQRACRSAASTPFEDSGRATRKPMPDVSLDHSIDQ